MNNGEATLGKEQEKLNDGIGIIFEENGTFCKVGSEAGGTFEVDLRITKQRGEEERYIALSANGFDDENQPSRTNVFLLDEQSFEKLKAFITNLKWND